MTCILGDVRSGRCSVFQGVGTSLQGALPVCRSLTFPKQKRFQINPPTDLLSNFHINNKTTLVFCLQVRTTCGFWLPRYDHHLLNPQSLRQEGKWGVRCQDFVNRLNMKRTKLINRGGRRREKRKLFCSGFLCCFWLNFSEQKYCLLS